MYTEVVVGWRDGGMAGGERAGEMARCIVRRGRGKLEEVWQRDANAGWSAGETWKGGGKGEGGRGGKERVNYEGAADVVVPNELLPVTLLLPPPDALLGR